MVLLAEILGTHLSQVLGVLVASYAVGCVTLGYYLVRTVTGMDVRQLGSGSVGAKNVGRVLGVWGFAVTFAGDLGKGALAVWATERVNPNDFLKLLAMLAVIVGHIWPAQLRFNGGKGMATAAGALLAFNPWIMAGLLAVFAVILVALRKTVLAGLGAFGILPLLSGLLTQPMVITFGFALLTLIVLFAHRQNLKKELADFAANRKCTTRPNPSPE